jgi:hypothetical protein
VENVRPQKMTKKKQKSTPQRNIVAKYAREFNRSVTEISGKEKEKFKRVKYSPTKHNT